MAKKIYVFADGTGNAYATQESNVWRLSQALDASKNDVAAKYIPGVGTSSFKPWAMFDAATGIGVTGNVQELYGFLCDEYEPECEIYMFGFSRGAFTIRTLIGLIASEGIVSKNQPRPDGVLEEADSRVMAKCRLAAWRNYRAKVAGSWPWWQRPFFVHVAGAIRKLRHLLFKNPYRNPRATKTNIKFVGLFDTVEAFGVPIEEMRIAIDRIFWPISFRNSRMSTIAQNVRHALSLDDERTSFHPLRIQAEDGEAPAHAAVRIKEVWFAGVHSDVGGGYPDGNLSYVPLIWMIDELRKIEGAESFRSEQVEYWRKHMSFFAPRHDSRATVAVLYRYAPRNVEPLGTDGSPIPPVVHHGVVERMAFGYDRYAPTPLSAAAKVWLPTRDVCDIRSSVDELPAGPDPALETACADAFKALKALDGPEDKLIEHARDLIWRRRIGYFVLLTSFGAFLTLPLYALPVSDWLCDKIGGFYPVRLWLDLWQGVGRALSPIIGAIVPNVAGYIEPYLTTMRRHPAMFFGLVLLLIWLYKRSAALAEQIVENTKKAWMKRDSGAAPASAVEDSSVVRAVRTHWLVTALHRAGAGVALPMMWAVVLALIASALVPRLVYEFDAGTNWTGMCVATKEPRVVPADAPIEANSLFRTSAPCWASGLEVENGRTYRLVLSIEEPWIDRTILTDARGFEPGGPLAEPLLYLTRPYLRWAFDPWFRPIIRIIGKYGDDEWPLDLGEGSEPSSLMDGACVGLARRYEHSSEYCRAHGHDTAEDCARDPLKFGLAEPLPEGERPIARAAFDNALTWSKEIPGCPSSSRAVKIFSSKFTAARSGEVFLFVNDLMPVLGNRAPFYRNNLGSAKITIQRIAAPNRQTVADVQEGR